jgi:hypothetical protein
VICQFGERGLVRRDRISGVDAAQKAGSIHINVNAELPGRLHPAAARQ